MMETNHESEIIQQRDPFAPSCIELYVSSTRALRFCLFACLLSNSDRRDMFPSYCFLVWL